MATIISIVSYPFLPAKSGGEKNVASFNKYFSKYHQLICITPKKSNPVADGGYEVQNLLSNSKLRYINFFYFFLIRKMIRQKKATHIILEHPYYGWLGVLLKRFCNVKLIVHSHNIEGLRWKTLGKWWWKILWNYEKSTHRNADYNFFIQDEDKKYAIDKFGLSPSKCLTVTYGIERNQIPSMKEIIQAKETIMIRHDIPSQNKILLFNGAFKYKPNTDALSNIIVAINPLLHQAANFPYSMIICGMDIPEEISSGKYPNIIVAGFVDDINIYFKGSDVFLNPVTEGGGIKTKLVEALAYNLNAVSTRHGAIGIDPEWCNTKLQVCDDNDWMTFAALVIKASFNTESISEIYFEHFYLQNIIRKAAAFIE
jgi:UDP-N-acetylglucosamine:LPS N-acetylglucosamine transferase